jgi:hypothetical protein
LFNGLKTHAEGGKTAVKQRGVGVMDPVFARFIDRYVILVKESVVGRPKSPF